MLKNKIHGTTPYNQSDISFPLLIENGDFKIVKGEEYGKQNLAFSLSINYGEMFHSPDVGSFISDYFWAFKENTELLNRLIKIEIIRLTSIPYFGDIQTKPAIDFVNRIIKTQILALKEKETIKTQFLEIKGNKLTIKIQLEWGDNAIWEDTLDIFILPKEDIQTNDMYKSLLRHSK